MSECLALSGQCRHCIREQIMRNGRVVYSFARCGRNYLQAFTLCDHYVPIPVSASAEGAEASEPAETGT